MNTEKNVELEEEDDDDVSEMWRAHNEEMKSMRQNRRERWEGMAARLAADGLKIVEITPYQFRIDGILDIYPSNKRWHDLRNNKRGDLRMNNVYAWIKNKIKSLENSL